MKDMEKEEKEDSREENGEEWEVKEKGDLDDINPDEYSDGLVTREALEEATTLGRLSGHVVQKWRLHQHSYLTYNIPSHLPTYIPSTLPIAHFPTYLGFCTVLVL